MKSVLATSLSLFTISCFSQVNETVFTVSKSKDVFVTCTADTLLANTTYHFKISGISTTDVIPGNFSGGKVWLNDTGVVIHTMSNPSRARKYFLQLFRRNGNADEVFSKNFTIVQQVVASGIAGATGPTGTGPDRIYWGNDWVGTNDTILKNELAKAFFLQALSVSKPDNNLRVVSFKIDITCDGKTESLNSSSLYFTREMKASLDSMKEGCKIILKEVKYISTNYSADNLIAGPFEIYVIE